MSPKLGTATASTAMNAGRFDVFEIIDLGNGHRILMVGTSRRFVLDLDSRLLWAGSFRLGGVQQDHGQCQVKCLAHSRRTRIHQ